MNGKIFLIVSLVLSMVLFVACESGQQGVPSDVSYVPIDDIQVENDESLPPSPPLNEDEGMSIDLNDIPVVEDEEVPQETPENEDVILDENIPVEQEPVEEVIPQANQSEQQAKEIVIIVQETDLVNLKPVASDPDQDKLEFTYSTPLNANGQWQTTYGDMGEYTITITASDGELTTSRDALLIVNKKEEPPVIESKTPTQEKLSIQENNQIEFSVVATDKNNDLLEYKWTLDGDIVSEDASYTLDADYNSAGEHTVSVEITDGTTEVKADWELTIENVDRPPVLKVIPDITVKETETVVIEPEASDPDGDEIQYTISEPVGDSGVWQTDYDSEGIYNVEVTASDGEMQDSQTVKVTVINVNRPPVIDNIIQVD